MSDTSRKYKCTKCGTMCSQDEIFKNDCVHCGIKEWIPTKSEEEDLKLMIAEERNEEHLSFENCEVI